jgi:hypothetical protein
LQTEFDLRSGAIQSIQIEQGRQTDSASSRQYADRRPGSLRITDLGYFNVKVFREIAESRAYFLTRLNFQTAVFLNGEKLPNLIKWLQSQTDEAIDLEVEVGAGVSLPCRMLASRVPPPVARRRCKRLRENCRRKRGRAPSKDALEACHWTVVITNVPAKKLSYGEAFVLCRARWQIELLFKRWKSQGLIAEMHARSDTHSMIQLWARLTVALIQHWLMIGVVWTNGIQQSFSRTIAATRDLALTIALFIGVKKKLIEMLQLICRTTKRTCLRTQRSRLGTFELMLTPESSAYP